MPLDHTSSRLSLSGLEGMARFWCGDMGGAGIKRRVLHSLRRATTSIRVPDSLRELFTQFRERKSFGGGGTDSYQEGSDRVGASRSRVLQPHFCSSESHGRVSSSDRLVSPQQVHPQDEISDGDQRFSIVGDSKGRLDDVSGSAGCLFSDPNSLRKQEVPSLCMGRSEFSVQSSLLRVVDCAAGLHKGHGSSVSSSTCKRNSSPSLLGRLATVSNFSEGGFEVEGCSPTAMREAPHKDQLEEVRVGSQSSRSILGDGDSLFSFLCFLLRHNSNTQ